MSSPILSYLLGASFVILVACFFVCVASGVVLFFIKWRDVNAAFKHPLLEVKPFKRYPMSLQAAIYLDYFFRLMFPKRTTGLIGNANRMLKHVNARELPFGVRVPIAGFWGGCFIGIIAMVAVWVLLLLQM